MDRGQAPSRPDAPRPARTPRPARRRAVALGLGTALVVGAGVVAVDLAGAPQAAAEASLQPFAGCDELVAWYREATLPHVGAYGLDGGMGIGMGGAMPGEIAVAESAADSSAGGAAPAARDGAATSGEAVGSSGTGTNVQEAGVDEPSRIKVGDGVVHTLAGDRLVVVDLAGGDVLGQVQLGLPDAAEGLGTTDGTAGSATGPAGDVAGLSMPAPQEHFSELLLLDDRVVVLGAATLPVTAPGGAPDDPAVGDDGVADVMPYPQPWGTPTTTATTVDVSDPTAPRVVDTVEVEGGYVSARASGGVVRLVTTATPVLPFVDPYLLQQQRLAGPSGEEVQGWSEPDPQDLDEALARNEQVVREATAADWLPDVVTRDEAGAVVGRTPVGCDRVAHPTTEAGTGTVTVLTLDPAQPDTLVTTTSVSADGSLVYASPDRLYVATTTGGWLWRGAGGEVGTQLHGFDTSRPARTDYLGSGEVEGWLLGSWAMDAHEGHLRVGTTSSSGPDGDGGADGTGLTDGADLARPAPVGATSSSVVVLRETADGLEPTGRVDGLGPGEQIRSLRWFDDMAVVVTFEQTDPLYTVDLTDPADPQVLGELKVLGYSGYLHPLGADLLLGLGQDGTADGTLLGAKVETYDLRDPAAPRDVDTLAWPRSSSAAEWDSRLFAYLPDLRTVVVPLEREQAGTYRSGLVAVAVGTDGTLRESGSWTGTDAGWLGGLATTGGEVLATYETWTDDGSGRARTVLAVLSADTLAVRAEVALD